MLYGSAGAGKGSSPLARGLPITAFTTFLGARIIPARAGFTGPLRPVPRHLGDHPRSRGVYPGTRMRSPRDEGSSPLARGLRETLCEALTRARIIPARAGFTWDGAGMTTGARDHPRSRGVYRTVGGAAGPCSGSSPLARGLPLVQNSGLMVRRIIPARAGFTGCHQGHAGAAGDHPRSRGVYSRQRPGEWRTGGSSPLARGLRPAALRRRPQRGDHPRSRGVYGPDHDQLPGHEGSSPLARGLLARLADWRGEARIIPARAGFTRPGWEPSVSTADHPRSRGVYSSPVRTVSPTRGSSPLARGLRGRGQAADGDGGIIPARAGFTSRAARSAASGADHPRSRGVYPPGHPPTRACPGSSPLARGLPARNGVEVTGGRIIPARAGFTPPGTPRTTPRRGSSPLARGLRSTAAWAAAAAGIIPARAGFTHRRPPDRGPRGDHPRSRGVYQPLCRGITRKTGSSPLARGLRQRVLERPHHERIIPARAGFTKPTTPRRFPMRDHPRSRGVYNPVIPEVSSLSGSSPLARGLPVCARSVPARGRIIPARAGFTDPCGLPAPQRRDHPRSRGVYGCTVVHRGGAPGSSPLARGLLESAGAAEVAVGIIPARAGFTCRRRGHGPFGPDHPRSRGVYKWRLIINTARRGSSPLARGLRDELNEHGYRARIIPARAGFTGTVKVMVAS